jgi:transcriptional regulator with GAF, ATPase, and Fis domain
MGIPTADSTQSSEAADAYVILQRGAARLEVVQLEAHLPMTVGRAPSNRIVVNDPKCSRQHCEFFMRSGRWHLRDLGSRNGVTVDGFRVDSEWELQVGQTIGIGACTLLFTDREPQSATERPAIRHTPFAVIERASGTKYDPPQGGRSLIAQGKHGLAEMFRLARAMNSASNVSLLTDCVLDGLLRGTAADCGAVLLLPVGSDVPDSDQLQLAAARPPDGPADGRFSAYLSQVVLSNREAILAHDLSENELLAARPSLKGMAASSAICAPIRHESEVLGVIHLYSTSATRALTAEHLEFTLAIADQMAGNLYSLQDRERLAEGISRAESRNRELRDQLEADTELIGTSEALQSVRRAIKRVAPTDATVLIRGESGVGKELVARALHFNSDRKDQPFVCVNCAALTETLLESELFGHEKGAFTGATAQKAGKFEQADGGTLFLDEIGEMQSDLQAKFLRVVEGQPYERVGGSQPITVDVRIVTATNRDLEQAVQQAKFRRDLYFRLQVIEIVVPPLREHPEDIAEIAAHFVERFSRKSRVRVRGFAPDAQVVLTRYAWPGNVRELRNVVERAVILADREVLHADDISLSRIDVQTDVAPAPVVEPAADRPTEPGDDGRLRPPGSTQPGPIDRLIDDEFSLDELERQYTIAVLERCGWNKSESARRLGIERTTLDRRLKKYGISRPEDE